MFRVLGVLAVLTALAGCSTNTVPTSSAAVTALGYLGKQAGVGEHVVEGNGVYVIFEKQKPKDWKAILEAAALAGEKATGAEFTASGVLGGNKNWRAYADSNTIGVVTARDGKIVK